MADVNIHKTWDGRLEIEIVVANGYNTLELVPRGQYRYTGPTREGGRSHGCPDTLSDFMMSPFVLQQDGSLERGEERRVTLTGSEVRKLHADTERTLNRLNRILPDELRGQLADAMKWLAASAAGFATALGEADALLRLEASPSAADGGPFGACAVSDVSRAQGRSITTGPAISRLTGPKPS